MGLEQLKFKHAARYYDRQTKQHLVVTTDDKVYAAASGAISNKNLASPEQAKRVIDARDSWFTFMNKRIYNVYEYKAAPEDPGITPRGVLKNGEEAAFAEGKAVEADRSPLFGGHLDFFDLDNDGKIGPEEGQIGWRALGYNEAKAAAKQAGVIAAFNAIIPAQHALAGAKQALVARPSLAQVASQVSTAAGALAHEVGAGVRQLFGGGAGAFAAQLGAAAGRALSVDIDHIPRPSGATRMFDDHGEIDEAKFGRLLAALEPHDPKRTGRYDVAVVKKVIDEQVKLGLVPKGQWASFYEVCATMNERTGKPRDTVTAYQLRWNFDGSLFHRAAALTSSDGHRGQELLDLHAT